MAGTTSSWLAHRAPVCSRGVSPREFHFSPHTISQRHRPKKESITLPPRRYPRQRLTAWGWIDSLAAHGVFAPSGHVAFAPVQSRSGPRGFCQTGPNVPRKDVTAERVPLVASGIARERNRPCIRFRSASLPQGCHGQPSRPALRPPFLFLSIRNSSSNITNTTPGTRPLHLSTPCGNLTP